MTDMTQHQPTQDRAVSRSATPVADRVLSVSPPGPDGTVDTDVFLTPRVLDQQAFDELTSTLRTLIDESHAATRSLAEMVKHAQTLDDDSQRAGVQLQERLRLGAKMLKAFQSQIDRVDRSLTTLEDHQQLTEAAGRKLHEQLASFDTQINTSIERHQVRLKELTSAATEELEARCQFQLNAASETELKLQRLSQAAEKQFAAHVTEHRAELCSSLEEIDRRIEQLASIDERINANLQDHETRLKEMSTAAVKDLEAHHRNHQQAVDETEHKIDAMAQAVLKQFATKVTSQRTVLADDLIEIQRRTELANQVIETRASDALNRMSEREQHSRATHTRIEQQLNEALKRAKSIDELVDRAEVNVAMLVHQSAESADQARIIAAEAREQADRCREAASTLTDDADQARQSVQSVIAELADRKEAVSTAVRQAADVERDLADQLTRINQSHRQVEEVGETCQRLDTLLKHLAPWEALTIGRKNESGLPKSLQDIMERLEQDLRRQLNQVASILHATAEHVENQSLPEPNSTQTTEAPTPRPIPAVSITEPKVSPQPSLPEIVTHCAPPAAPPPGLRSAVSLIRVRDALRETKPKPVITAHDHDQSDDLHQ